MAQPNISKIKLSNRSKRINPVVRIKKNKGSSCANLTTHYKEQPLFTEGEELRLEDIMARCYYAGLMDGKVLNVMTEVNRIVKLNR